MSITCKDCGFQVVTNNSSIFPAHICRGKEVSAKPIIAPTIYQCKRCGMPFDTYQFFKAHECRVQPKPMNNPQAIACMNCGIVDPVTYGIKHECNPDNKVVQPTVKNIREIKISFENGPNHKGSATLRFPNRFLFDQAKSLIDIFIGTQKRKIEIHNIRKIGQKK